MTRCQASSASRRSRRFVSQANVEIGPIGDALIYREYTLALIWPRSCPEYIDDDEVSEWLRYCADTEELPWAM